LFPGSASAFLSSQRRPLAVQGRRVYFHATTPADDCALFVSDGTAAGTHCAVDPLEGLTASALLDEVLALPSGAIAFTAWRAGDGDEVRALHAGQLLPLVSGDIHPGAGSSQPLSLTATPRGMVYFSADDGSTGREVWRMDLTDFLFADGFE
jgi:ELWxxDGT repeat protein